MRTTDKPATLDDVRDVYEGAEGKLWELVMGEQIHIGGLTSSMDLADKADIRPGTTGVDLCSCAGAGMRFLVRFRQVGEMHGVDATAFQVGLGRRRTDDEGYGDRIFFTHAEATDTELPEAMADFVWGEDAWCYVADKGALIREAVRLVKPGGTIAFTDWVEGPTSMTDQEATRLLTFMKFPNIESIDGYRDLLKKNGCTVKHAEHTGRFAPYCKLYIDMLTMQLTWDALKVIDFDQPLMQALADEMAFLKSLADQGKIEQGLFVAVR